MTLQEWLTVCRLLETYGAEGPCVDIGGLPNPELRDLSREEGWNFPEGGRCYDHAVYGYEIVNPERDYGMTAEALATLKPRSYRTVISTSTLEHTPSPWAFVWACAGMLRPGGLLLLTVPWRWPTHGTAAGDFWRVSEAGLRQLCEPTDLVVLETGLMDVTEHKQVAWVAASRGPLGPDRPAPKPKPELEPA